MKSSNGKDVIDAPDLVMKSGSGRAAWDERGNSVWEWQTEPGVFTREISSHQLTQLQTTQLRLVEPSPARNFEGLWIHDSDRGAVATRAEQVSSRAVSSGDGRRRADRPAKRGAFDAFMRRLGFAG